MNQIPEGHTLLVTGGSGFIGQHLIESLEERNISFQLIGRRDQSRTGASISNWKTAENLAKEISEICNPILVNLAGHFVSKHEPQDLERLISGNVEFNSFVFEACRIANVSNIVNIGTNWEASPEHGNGPANLYATLKKCSYEILRWYSKNYGIRAIHLLLYDTYGDNDSRSKLMPYIKKCVGENSHILLHNPNKKINLTHVDDVIEAILVACNRVLETPNDAIERFSVMSSETESIGSLLKVIERVTSRELKFSFQEDSVQPLRIADNSKPLPGWRPKVSLESGLASYLENIL
jgi:nucleoside-diphosphate-sugar epimerase